MTNLNRQMDTLFGNIHDAELELLSEAADGVRLVFRRPDGSQLTCRFDPKAHPRIWVDGEVFSSAIVFGCLITDFESDPRLREIVPETRQRLMDAIGKPNPETWAVFFDCTINGSFAVLGYGNVAEHVSTWIDTR